MLLQNFNKFYHSGCHIKRNKLKGGSGTDDKLPILSINSIKKLKVSELKSYLKKLNLSVEGLKSDLQTRLINHIHPPEEEELFECENDCGFKGSFSEVEIHEKTCTFIKDSENVSTILPESRFQIKSEPDPEVSQEQVADIVLKKDDELDLFKTRLRNNIFSEDPEKKNRTNLVKYKLDTMNDFPSFINDNSLNEREKKENTLGTTGSDKGLTISHWYDDTKEYNKIIPFRHQKFVIDYLNHNTPYRGLLLYHGLGSGKTGAAVMIAQGYPYKKTAILLPASLRSNFRDEIYKYGEISYKKNFFWINIPINSDSLKVNKSEYFRLLYEKGIPEELFKLIIKSKSQSSEPSIWIVDPSQKTSNYHTLNEFQQISLNSQIDIMVNYKYQFIHYNSGSYSVIGDIKKGNSVLNLLEDYQSFYRSIVGDKIIQDLTPDDQQQLINKLYENDTNPFNNKVIIIDEIHNFTAGIVGSIHKSRIYELIVRSKNSNLIFLSGTPVINKPYELALLFNMLKGIFTAYKVTLNKSSGSFNSQELSEILNKNLYIERFEIDQTNSEIIFTKVTEGFKKKIDKTDITFIKHHKSEKENAFLNNIKISLEKQGYTTISVIKNESTIFPDILSDNSSIIGTRLISKLDGVDYKQLKEDEFNQYYIDSTVILDEEISSGTKSLIKNPNSFKNRILGTVSFYNEVSSIDKSEIIFPEKIFAPHEKIDIIMSDYQFILYSQSRMIEKVLEDQIKKTKLSKANSGSVLSEPSSLFRVYTRQKGLFVFPPNIQRPMLMEVRLLDKLEKGIKKLIMSGSIDKYVNDLISFTKNPIETPTAELDDDVSRLSSKQSLNRLKQKIINYIDDTVKEILAQDKKVQEFTKNIFLIIFDLIFDVNLNYSYDIDFIDTISKLKSDIRQSSLNKKNEKTSVEDILEQLKDFNLQDFLSSEQGTYGELCKKAIEGLTKDNLTVNESLFNLNILSPKYVKVLENIFNSKGPVVIYSQYRQVEGIETLSKTLEFNGYTKIDTKKIPIEVNNDIIVGDKVRYTIPDTFNSFTYHVVNINTVDRIQKYTIVRDYDDEGNYLGMDSQRELVVNKNEIHKCRFALWTGTESKEERDDILQLFNNQKNNLGNLCLMLLITQSGAEGINLFCVRQVHILEPYWNNVRINQVIGRARRVHSHKSLPDIHRNVEIFNYVIKFSTEQLNGEWIDLIPDDIVFGIKKFDNNIDAFRIENSGVTSFINSDKQGNTSDQVLLQISNEKDKILSEFLNLMKEVAIDCNFNKEANINSNTELAHIKCYDNPSDRVDKNYVLDIDVHKIKSKNQDLFTKTVTKKRETIPFQFLFNSSPVTLNVFTILSTEVLSWTDMREDTDLFNWYRFNGLDPLHRNEFDKLEKIGFFKIIGSKQQFILDTKFKKNIKNYIKIHNCLDKITIKQSISYPSVKSKNRIKQVEFNNLVFQCFDGSESTWICPGCDSEYDYTLKFCEECEISKEEVLETDNKEFDNLTDDSTEASHDSDIKDSQLSLSDVSLSGNQISENIKLEIKDKEQNQGDEDESTTQERNLGKDTAENIRLEINESEDSVWKNNKLLAKWWEQNGCDQSMANSGDTPNQIAHLQSLATKYEEDFQRNLQQDILSADDEFLDRWNLTYVKDLIQDQGQQDESATQEANLGDTESGDSETSPVTQSVDTSTS